VGPASAQTYPLPARFTVIHVVPPFRRPSASHLTCPDRAARDCAATCKDAPGAVVRGSRDPPQSRPVLLPPICGLCLCPAPPTGHTACPSIKPPTRTHSGVPALPRLPVGAPMNPITDFHARSPASAAFPSLIAVHPSQPIHFDAGVMSATPRPQFPAKLSYAHGQHTRAHITRPKPLKAAARHRPPWCGFVYRRKSGRDDRSRSPATSRE